MSAQIKLSIEGHVAVVTMSNPPANTWTKETLTQLRDMVEDLNNNKDVQKGEEEELKSNSSSMFMASG